MKSIKVLFVTTSNDKLGDTNTLTGVWLEEFTAPYYIFTDAGVEIIVASPKGGPVPMDPKSQSIIVATQSSKRFLKDAEAMKVLSQSTRLQEIKAADFDMVFIPGGHGPLWDLADNPILTELLNEFNREDKPIGAVCHGVVALLPLHNDKGEPVVRGKKITAFSNSEEESAGLTKTVPFLVETELVSLGALYSKGANYVSHVVTDGNIITGQNPASSEELAKAMLVLLRHNQFLSLSRKEPFLN